MKISKVVYLLKKHNPTSSSDARAVGIPMEFLNDGYYRKAYRVPGTPVVVKFPVLDGDNNTDDDSFASEMSCVSHGRNEIESIKDLLGSPFKKYAPKVYYTNPNTGVVAMRFYKGVGRSKRLERLAEKIERHFGTPGDSDLHSENFGRKGKRGLVIRDLGTIG